jgi:ABC-type glycerol-3-phosphate transport system permease component
MGIKTKRRLSPLMIVILCILTVYCLSIVCPIVWALISTLKDDLDFRYNILGLPKNWIFSNYAVVFKNFIVEVYRNGELVKINMPQQVLNSMVYSVGSAFLGIFVTCVMAHATVRFPNAFSKFIRSVVIVTMIMPIVGSLPSTLQTLKFLGLYDRMIGILILSAGGFSGTTFLIMQGAFKGIPKDLISAAQIDGASNLTIFIRIMLPLVKTVFLTFVLLAFIETWNNFQISMLYLPSRPMLAYGLYLLKFNTNNELATVPLRLASCMLMMLPVLVIFLICQKRLIGNLTVGGIKG